MNEPRVLIGIPTAGMVSIDFTYSLCGLISYHNKRGIRLDLEVIKSSVIVSNREKLARAAVDGGYTHLMFLDDDMAFAPEVLSIMLGRRHPVVVTNYLIKGEEPQQFVAIGEDGQRVLTTEESSGIVPIIYSGFGVSLFDVEVFKRLQQPWFAAEFDAAESAYTTEDYAFFKRVHERGFDVLLDQDASKLLGHVGRKVWRWQEWKAPAIPIGEANAKQEVA